MNSTTSFVLPPKPEKPRDEDCCKSDCEMCVFNVYEKQVLEWEKLCNEIKKQTIKAQFHVPSILSQSKYTPCQLVNITSVTPNTKIYRFQVSPNALHDLESEYTVSLNIDIGQHLIMKNSNAKCSVITRAYTPISDFEAHVQGYFDVLIKVYSGGKMSHYVKTWSIGETVYWRGPFGNFSYSKNKYNQVIMCCCGTGIAPMLRLIRSIVEDDEEETLLHLLYSCKKYEEVLLHDEMSNFKSFWNFSSYLFITRELPQSVRYGEKVIHGRITLDFLKLHFSEKCPDRILVLICGTDSFNNDIKNFVKNIGILESNIHVF